MTDSVHATRVEMLREAKAYQDACWVEGEPGWAKADDLLWADELTFDLTKIDGFTEGEFESYDGEIEERVMENADDLAAGLRYIHNYRQAVRDNTIDPIIAVEGTNGWFYLWDGNHRTGTARLQGRTTLHAFVGDRQRKEAYAATSSQSQPALDLRASIVPASD